MKANWNSATADWHWQITEPVQPERNAVLARAQPSSLTDLDVQLVHATGAAQALMSSARMYAGPVDVPEATASRPFGMRHGSASSQTGSDSATHEGHGHYARTEPRYLSRRTLALACSYMEDNLGENFTLGDLGKAVGVSPFHFSRLFRVSTGQSPMAYWRRLRIERAKEMLLRAVEQAL